MYDLSLVDFVSFFFTPPASTEIYTLSLHDALPISRSRRPGLPRLRPVPSGSISSARAGSTSAESHPGSLWCARRSRRNRSEEHTSELQSRQYLVCRLLLEKKKVKSHGFTSSTAISK